LVSTPFTQLIPVGGTELTAKLQNNASFNEINRKNNETGAPCFIFCKPLGWDNRSKTSLCGGYGEWQTAQQQSAALLSRLLLLWRHS